MKRLSYILSTVLLAGLLMACGAKKSQTHYSYESRIIGTELDGSYTIRAWGKGRNAVDAYHEAKKQAVYEVILKGVKSADNKIKPLLPILLEVNAEKKYETYFNKFFADGGEWEKYVSLKERRTNSSEFVRNKQQSMAQVTVCVDRAALVERLRQDGILY